MFVKVVLIYPPNIVECRYMVFVMQYSEQ